MNFTEAMEELRNGNAVKCCVWDKDVYWKDRDGVIATYSKDSYIGNAVVFVDFIPRDWELYQSQETVDDVRKYYQAYDWYVLQAIERAIKATRAEYEK